MLMTLGMKERAEDDRQNLPLIPDASWSGSR